MKITYFIKAHTRNTFINTVTILTGFFLCLPVTASGLSDYVARCKTELEFSSIPQFDCRNENFRTPIPGTKFRLSNDFVAYKKITEKVDAIFACRWVQNNSGDSGAATGEMIVHNRESGKTCFFSMINLGAEEGNVPRVSTTNPVSPTHSRAADFWEDLAETPNLICTDCHAAGPYIASPQIVGALAKYGLINDHHDTMTYKYTAIDPGPRYSRKYNDNIRDTVLGGCSAACHAIHDGSHVPSFGNRSSDITLPSINLVMADVSSMGEMPPNDPYSDYRWINRDTPNSSDGMPINTGYGDYETLSAVEDEFPLLYCKNPKEMQARRVGSNIIISTNDAPNTLRTFNLQDGLVCKNEDYPDNHPYKCFNYQTRYKCNGSWTQWYDTDSPGGSGDDESRSRINNLCANPSDIQARYRAPTSSAPWVGPTYGPRDRLSQFNTKGLKCKNGDQDDNTCSNYSVRFICK